MAQQNLHGHVALVTGASRRRSIGAAICRALAAAGADVCFTHWQPYDELMPWGADAEAPSILQDELRRGGVRAEALAVDLSTPDAAAGVIDVVHARLGPVSILVNNATYSTRDGYGELDAHYAVNVRATVLLSVAFVRRYGGGSGGRIINLTSGQSLAPMPEELAYATTKGAVEAFTRSLAAAVAAQGITVNAVNPGPTDTGWMTAELQHELLPRFPQGRIGQPNDAARLVTFLASDAAQWITGQVIHSEGGFLRN